MLGFVQKGAARVAPDKRGARFGSSCLFAVARLRLKQKKDGRINRARRMLEMTWMYVANATKQTHEFIYRLPEKTEAHRQSIQPGSQIRIPLELSQPDLDAVIAQHERYGMIHISQVDKTKPFAGLVYSLDRPVHETKMQELIQHNEDVLVQRGRKIREEAAIATNQRMERDIFEARMPDQLREVEIGVEEVTGTRDPSDHSAEVSEIIRVSQDVEERSTKPRPRRERRRL